MYTHAMIAVDQDDLARNVRRALLAWYDVHRRDLPWRAKPGETVDPYRVWLSEIMLQQTTTGHAAPYFLEFTGRWPTVAALAAEDDSVVMAAWAGLGYYARARNLLACARMVAAEHGGVFPKTEEGLRTLPGVGDYTAAAIAAIAFDRPANVVDGNVERVMARLFAVETPLPAAKPELRRLAGALVADDRPGDWAQALMDLGATLCRPKSPDCLICPVRPCCLAAATGEPAKYPRSTPKTERPRRHGAVFVARSGGRVAVVRRPPKGLLGGMIGLPTTAWTEQRALTPHEPPFEGSWMEVGEIDHVFTHFALTLTVNSVDAADADGSFQWMPEAEAARALPTLFAKALRASVKPAAPSRRSVRSSRG